MNSLKTQILELYQNFYDHMAFNIWVDYKESAKQMDKLLTQIYHLVKEYKDDNYK